MITYIVYEDSEQYSLDSLWYLYQHMECSEEIFLIEKPKEPSMLCSVLASLPLKRMIDEWRILFLDCRQVYACENPYESYEDNFQYIEAFLEICTQAGRKKHGRQVMRTLPELICCMVMRCGQYFHTPEEGFLYSGFADSRSSRYRYLLFDVGEKEPELPEYILFQVLCSAYTLALNEFPKAVLDAGFLYQLRPWVDEEKLAKYIGDMDRTRRYLATLLYQEKQRGDCGERVNYVRDIPEREVMPQGVEGAILFQMEKFPFVQEDNEAALAGFRLTNIKAIQRLRALSKNPGSSFLGQAVRMDFEYEDQAGKRLSNEGMCEFSRKKQNCAEELFREKQMDAKLLEQLAKGEERLVDVERSMRSRMTRRGLSLLLKKDSVSLGIIGIAFGMLIGADGPVKKGSAVAWLAVFLYIIIVAASFMRYYASERKRMLKRLNRSLRQVNDSLNKAEHMYLKRMERASVHRRYSLFELRQQELGWVDEERQQLMEEYEELLLKSEGKIQQLLWIFGRQPESCEEEESKTSVDFSLPPKSTIDAYMANYRDFYELTMAGVGIKLQVPFSFLSDFEIKKLYLPYVGRESRAEGNDYEHK